MKPIEFPGANVVWAKDQPEYQPLPARVEGDITLTCWRLTWWERLKVLLLGRLWLQQMNYRQPLQPQLPSVDSPIPKEHR